MRIGISKILRIFEAEDCKKKFEVFDKSSSKNLKVRGEDEVLSFKVFLRFLKIPRKIQPKVAFINYIDRF